MKNVETWSGFIFPLSLGLD